MGKTTDNLLKELSNLNTESDLLNFTNSVEESAISLSFHEYIGKQINRSKLAASDIIRASGIQRNYAYQIINGNRNPGRNKVIALCIALKLPLEEVQRALTIAKEGILYPKIKRDSVLIFCINKSCSVQETNELLFELDEEVL